MKPFAIYFPQYYPIRTNDVAWGNGFTDWVLVANANMTRGARRRAPLRGFYDGAAQEVHADQIREAAAAGIGGFGVYHYWFYSHQELDAFERTLLGGGGAGVPWFLIWACEGWSKRWLGNPEVILELSPEPSAAEIGRHCDHLAVCFAHPDYLRLDGKPLFCWYNLGHFTDPARVLERYRVELRARGHDVVMSAFVKNPFDVAYSAHVEGSYVFEPRMYFGLRRGARGQKSKRALEIATRLLGRRRVEGLLVQLDRLQQHGTTYSADDFVAYMGSSERRAVLDRIPHPPVEVISAGWDNTPRYGKRFTALEALAPEVFGDLVRRARASAPPGGPPVLINAWNEWSESAAIEPCAYEGRSYLDQITRITAER